MVPFFLSCFVLFSPGAWTPSERKRPIENLIGCFHSGGCSGTMDVTTRVMQWRVGPGISCDVGDVED